MMRQGRGYLLLLAAAMAILVDAHPSDTLTSMADNARTGFYPNANMDPAVVADPTAFVQRFVTQLPGSYASNGTALQTDEIFATPLVFTPPASPQIVLAVTMINNAYVLDAVSGAIIASRNFGNPFYSGLDNGHPRPFTGIMGTPVIDPDTSTAYFMAYVADTTTTGYPIPRYMLHAVSLPSLQDALPGVFPVDVSNVVATNDPAAAVTFDPYRHRQRPALLLMASVVYTLFGSHGDHTPYQGWSIGVHARTGRIMSAFSTQVGAGWNIHGGASIWQSGSGPATYDNQSFYFITANGHTTELTAPSAIAPKNCDNCVIKLTVQPDGSTRLTDFFQPYNYTNMNLGDHDFGSGGITIVSAPDNNKYVLAGGKTGPLYGLSATNLGQFAGPAGPDHLVFQANPHDLDPQTANGGGLWGQVVQHPDQNLVYANLAGPYLLVYRVTIDPSSSSPILVRVATVATGRGRNPAVTTIRSKPNSSLLWIQGNVYNAIPTPDGRLTLIRALKIANTVNWSNLGFGNAAVYYGTTVKNASGVTVAAIACFGSVEKSSSSSSSTATTTTSTSTVGSSASSAATTSASVTTSVATTSASVTTSAATTSTSATTSAATTSASVTTSATSATTTSASVGSSATSSLTPPPTLTTTTTTSATTAATTTPTTGTWTDLGCYSDTTTHTTFGPATAKLGTGFTPITCQSACAASSYVLAGVENGGNCFCGNTIANATGTVTPSAKCNYACAVDKTVKCGGHDAIEIFAFA